VEFPQNISIDRSWRAPSGSWASIPPVPLSPFLAPAASISCREGCIRFRACFACRSVQYRAGYCHYSIYDL